MIIVQFIPMLATDLETRLAAVEAEVEQLKSLLPMGNKTPWWEKIVGTFAADPVYEEAMKLGRQYRESLKLEPEQVADY